MNLAPLTLRYPRVHHAMVLQQSSLATSMDLYLNLATTPRMTMTIAQTSLMLTNCVPRWILNLFMVLVDVVVLFLEAMILRYALHYQSHT